ncbi:hypothetical protein M0R04_12820 [Candidatus Dojkabacteria bacterium]|jgi:predicted SAM-dependent methyltransferase|nr:hypothetical protein [Candidatus Dojkabacteria bacterium]
MTKLNIGAGNLPKEGFKNIDISKEAKADEYYDATAGLKEEDDSIDEIHCGCMMEQIESNKDFIFFLNECWRVLKKGGIMNGYVPSIDPKVLFIDPVDRRFFKVETFDYFNKEKHHWIEFGRIYGFKGWSKTWAGQNSSGIIHFELVK